MTDRPISTLAAVVRQASADLTIARTDDPSVDPLSLRFEVRMHPESLPPTVVRFCGYSVVRSRLVPHAGAWLIETSRTPWAVARIEQHGRRWVTFVP